MSMITCSQDCYHQQEGYCALDNIVQLSGSTAAKCGYYKRRKIHAKKPDKDIISPSAENPECIG